MAEPRRAAVPRPPVPLPVLLGGLGLAQILGWGSTFYLPAVLGPPMGAALGLGQDIVFGGVTVMYLVGAVASPRLGREIEARGARPVMAAGTVLAAVALALLGFAEGLATRLPCDAEAVGEWVRAVAGETQLSRAVPEPA